MCVGILSIEAAKEYPEATYIVSDNNSTQIDSCYKNIHYANLSSLVDILKVDMKKCPLRNSSVNVILSDLPFGKRFGSLVEIESLYPSILLEIDRVLVPGGKCVLLTNQISLLENNLFHLKVDQKIEVSLGDTTAFIYCLSKSPSSYHSPIH